MKITTEAQIHRFHNAVAISMPEVADTVYLHLDLARQLAKQIENCCTDIRAVRFSESRFRGRELAAGNFKRRIEP